MTDVLQNRKLFNDHTAVRAQGFCLLALAHCLDTGSSQGSGPTSDPLAGVTQLEP